MPGQQRACDSFDKACAFYLLCRVCGSGSLRAAGGVNSRVLLVLVAVLGHFEPPLVSPCLAFFAGKGWHLSLAEYC
jgi:hypothetical protein